MKRLAYVTSLSVIVLLVFAAVAVAQSTPDQGSADQGSSDPSGSEQTQSSDSSTPVYIHISNQGFDPAQLDVAPGTEVVWVNDATQPHTVTSDDGKLIDSGTLEPGKTYGVWLDGSGTVTYHADSNPDVAGSIVVGGASSGEQTTPASDTTTPTGDTTQPTEETHTSGS